MMISYGCVYKISIKQVMKGGRVETIEAVRKEYAELVKEGWKKTSIFRSFFNLKKYLHNFSQLVILVDSDKFKCKIKELKK